MPFLMLGLDGIITGPFGAKRFKNVDQIEDLFFAIEDVAGLLIDIDDIWLPLSLFERYSRPREGNVYRLDGSLFALAFAFREGRIDTEFFLSNCRDMDRPLFFSRKETRVFRQWRSESLSTPHQPGSIGTTFSWSGKVPAINHGRDAQSAQIINEMAQM